MRSFSSKCWQLLLDNANIFKAFIGTNFLMVSFALSMSGLYLGIAGLVLIATVTVHCCYLIVKCKRFVIADVIKKFDLTPETSLTHRKLVQSIEKSLSYGDVARLSLGKWGIWLTNFSLVLTQFGFCTNYFVFIGNTVERMFPFVNATISDWTNVSTTPLPFAETATEPFSNLSYIIENTALQSTAPPYQILMLIPFPIFIAFAYLRSIRQLGSSSIIANLSVFVAYSVVMYYILRDFEVSKDIVKVNWAKFPIFFGQVTGSYEGIGTIIPIESSMEGNRHLYPLLLHLNVLFFTALMASIGIMGYLYYGANVEQVITWSLPLSDPLTLAVNITLVIAVIFTFPLQVFPIIEILEQITFGPGRCLGPPAVQMEEADDSGYGNGSSESDASGQCLGPSLDRELINDSDSDEEAYYANNENKPLVTPTEDEEEAFMRETFKQCVVTVTIPSSVATWKRNVLRTLVVIVQAGLALLLHDSIAYFGAFVGAIGSTILGFILPCSIHLVLRGKELHPIIWVKNICLIVLGVAGGVSGVYASIDSIINEGK
ncbi:proton-coupled amino acid transporter 1-like [Diadema antillarum]|uniref:proton-coupled amino acid transporter 1-like n=1 Tax=Diadema antillarum TaxID=105358 RepID=UPI003A86C5B5